MRKTARRLVFLALAISLLFSLTACGGQSSSTSEAPQGSSGSDSEQISTNGEKISAKDALVMVSPYTDTGNYNPYSQATSQAGVVNNHCLEGLLRMTSEGDYECILAESYEWTDELTIEVKLRSDVYFHNGDLMTVEDVIFSNEMSKASAAGAQDWRMIDRIEKVDDSRIKYCLSYTDTDAINALTSKITSKAYYEKVGEQAFGTAPVGTGYFMWDSYMSGDSVTFKAFDKYWGEHGTVKTLTIRFISELSQALIELENGNVDIIPANGSTMASIEGNDDITTLTYSSQLNEYCGFNYNSEKVKDIRVRQALSYAVDRDALIAGAREGFAIKSYGVIMSYVTSLYDSNVEDYYKYNPDKARELLAEIGYSESNPLSLTLLTDTSTARTLEAQQLKNMLDAVGFNITISTFESATVTSILTGGNPEDYDLIIRAVNANPGAPLAAPARTLSFASTEKNNNPIWLKADSHELAEKYDTLVSEAKQAIDPKVKAEKYAELQKIEREMCMVCWLLCPESCYALNGNMKDYYVTGQYINLEKVYFVE